MAKLVFGDLEGAIRKLKAEYDGEIEVAGLKNETGQTSGGSETVPRQRVGPTQV